MGAVEGVVLAQVFVETDSQRPMPYDDALVEGADLCIYAGHLEARQLLLQPAEGTTQLLVHIVEAGILLLHVGKHALQGGVLEEVEELGVDIRVVHVAQLQHILYQHARLHGIAGVHLL